MQEKIIEELRNELKEQIKENQELLKINEEHQKINGELRKEIDALITVIDLIKECAQELRWFDNESVEFEISNKLLEILERVNEE